MLPPRCAPVCAHSVLTRACMLCGARLCRYGVRPTTGCHLMSGTSVGAPVVTGALALLAIVVPEDVRWTVLNPASAKQILMHGASRVDGNNMFEQGAGVLNLIRSYEYLTTEFRPHVSFFPSALHFSQDDCPYAWPYCSQPLYTGAIPIVANVTILNSLAVASSIVGTPRWQPSEHGELLDVRASGERR